MDKLPSPPFHDAFCTFVEDTYQARLDAHRNFFYEPMNIESDDHNEERSCKLKNGSLTEDFEDSTHEVRAKKRLKRRTR